MMNDKRKLEAAEVRGAAKGQWLEVLQALCPEIEAQLAHPGRHAACPVHGGNDGFRLFRDAAESGGGICNTCGALPDGFALLMWLKGWDFPAALEAVADVLGGNRPAQNRSPAVRQIHRPKARPPLSDTRIRGLLRGTLAGSVPWDHPEASLLRAYLRHRGLDPSSVQKSFPLRIHPAMTYRDENGRVVGRFPAMLGLMSGADGKPVTFHRTYLGLNGRKAPVLTPKKLMPHTTDRPVIGGAIRLGDPVRCIGIAEGIETALAVRQATGMTVWASTTNTLMMRFQPPPGVEQVAIWADHDQNGAGQWAAEALQANLRKQSIDCVVFTPPSVDTDWLDVWIRHQYAGFPILRDLMSAAA